MFEVLDKVPDLYLSVALLFLSLVTAAIPSLTPKIWKEKQVTRKGKKSIEVPAHLTLSGWIFIFSLAFTLLTGLINIKRDIASSIKKDKTMSQISDLSTENYSLQVSSSAKIDDLKIEIRNAKQSHIAQFKADSTIIAKINLGLKKKSMYIDQNLNIIDKSNHQSIFEINGSKDIHFNNVKFYQ